MIAGVEKTVGIWDPFALGTSKITHRFEGSAGPAAVSPDGRWLVTGVAGQHMLKRWDLRTGQPDKSWRGRSASFRRLAISSDNRILAAGLADGTIMLWDMEDGSEPLTLMAHEEAVTGLAFSHHGYSLLSASLDHTVRVRDGSMTNRQPSSIRLAHGVAAVAVSFSRDSRYLASVARENVGESGEEQHTLKLWDVSTWTELAHATLGGGGPDAETAFSPDGSLVTADDPSGILRVYRVPGLELVADLKGHLARFLLDGHSVMYACGNRILRRDATAAEQMPELVVSEEPGEIIAMSVSPDGRTVATTSKADQGFSIHLWDVAARRSLGTLGGHSNRVHRLMFSTVGQTLASAGWDGNVGVWDVRGRLNQGMMQGHSDEVYGVAFSPDGRTLASSGTDAVRLWHIATSRQVAVLETGGALQCVAFSPDGHWLAGAGGDGTVRLWRAPLLQELEPDQRAPEKAH